MYKIIISLLVSLCFISCSDDIVDENSNIPTVSDVINQVDINGTDITYYVKSTGNDSTGDGSNSSPYLSVQKAVNVVIAANDADLSTVNNYIIIIDGTTTAELSTPNTTSIVLIDSNNPLSLTLMGQNNGIIDADNKSKNVLRVYGENVIVTIDGGLELTNGGIGGIFASEGATIKLMDGKIHGNKANYGAGVYLDESTLVMSGGEITDNIANEDGDGAGVYVEELSRAFLSGDTKIYNNTNAYTESNLHLKYYAKNMGRLFINGALSATANIGYEISDQASRAEWLYAIFSTSSYTMTANDMAKVTLDNVVGNYVAYQFAFANNTITLVPHDTITAISDFYITASITPTLDGVRFAPESIVINFATVNPGSGNIINITGSGVNFNTQAVVNAVKAIDVTSSLPVSISSAVVSDDASLSGAEVMADTREVVTITYTSVDSNHVFSNGTTSKTIEIVLNFDVL